MWFDYLIENHFDVPIANRKWTFHGWNRRQTSRFWLPMARYNRISDAFVISCIRIHTRNIDSSCWSLLFKEYCACACFYFEEFHLTESKASVFLIWTVEICTWSVEISIFWNSSPIRSNESEQTDNYRKATEIFFCQSTNTTTTQYSTEISKYQFFVQSYSATCVLAVVCRYSNLN